MRLFMEITYNFGILIAISIIAGFVFQRFKSNRVMSTIQGLLFGMASIIGMLHPVVVSQGLIFDGRSVMISLAGLYYGPLAGIISAAMAIILRIFQGGVGTKMGVSVILTSAIIGVFFHYKWVLKEKKVSEIQLLLFGLLVHTGMLCCTLALPAEIRFATLSKIWAAVMISYPLAGLIIGKVLSDTSDHWRIKKELEASEEKFRLLVKNASDVIVILEPNGLQRYVSPSAEKITGYPISELQGKTITEIIHPDDIPGIMVLWQQLLDNPDITPTAQYRHIHKTKGWVYLEAVGQNFLAEPSIKGIVTSVRDISERKQSEDDLRESEEKFRSLAESTPTAIMIYQDDMWIYSNSAGLDITEFTLEEFCKMHFWDFVHPDDRKLIFDRGQQRLNGDTKVRHYEIRIRTKTGKVKWMNLTGASTVLKGKPAGIVSVIDITKRKEVEFDLITEKERLLVTLRSIGDGVITTDTEGRIIMLNSIAEKLTGWQQDEAAGQLLSTVFKIINENTGAICENPVEKVLHTGQIQELANHTVLIARDNTRRVIADSGAPIKDQTGSIMGVVLVFRDMTEKLKLVETAQQAQKLESIGLLAGGIAHDFNNLLGGIFGYLGLARIKSADGNINDLLDKASTAIERARSLTQQLLTFAKGGEPVLKNQPLTPFIEETVCFALSGSTVSAKFEIADDLRHAEIDKNQIAQVIDNLIINAKEAMPNGGFITVRAKNIEIEEKTHPLLAPGEYIKVSVSDQGIGIGKDILAQIFDPFFTTKSRGHGLGLAMCYSIIRKHEGLIEVESELGKGSVFHLYMPASKVLADDETVSINNASGTISGRIMVMDDEEMLREIITEILELIGYQVVAVPNGESAVKLFIEEKSAGRSFKALIFDLTVPGGMGGREAIAEIRKIDPEVPAFVSSGYGKDPAIANPKEYGFLASISKPFTIEELKQTLSKYLSS